MRTVAPSFAWWLDATTGDLSCCTAVEEGVNGHLLDQDVLGRATSAAPGVTPTPAHASPFAFQLPHQPAASADAPTHADACEGGAAQQQQAPPVSPVVELTSAEVAQQLELLPGGLIGRGEQELNVTLALL